MKFDEFIKKAEVVLNQYGRVTFSYSYSDNGDAFGIIQKSNKEGLLISGDEVYKGDGDTAVANIKICDSIEEAFAHIWEFNNLDNECGSYRDWDFRFDKVEQLFIDHCYYIFKK